MSQSIKQAIDQKLKSLCDSQGVNEIRVGHWDGGGDDGYCQLEDPISELLDSDECEWLEDSLLESLGFGGFAGEWFTHGTFTYVKDKGLISGDGTESVDTIENDTDLQKELTYELPAAYAEAIAEIDHPQGWMLLEEDTPTDDLSDPNTPVAWQLTDEVDDNLVRVNNRTQPYPIVFEFKDGPIPDAGNFSLKQLRDDIAAFIDDAAGSLAAAVEIELDLEDPLEDSECQPVTRILHLMLSGGYAAEGDSVSSYLRLRSDDDDEDDSGLSDEYQTLSAEDAEE